MVNFTYYTPTKIVFGADTENQVSELIKEFKGQKVLIHYGQQSVVKSGLLNNVKENLKENNIDFELLGGVVANPLLSKVKEGIALTKAKNIDFVLALGGGSVIDSAKAIAVGAITNDKVEDLIGKKDINQSLPVGAILTIAAAGSEMSATSVITNDQTLLKRSFSGDAMRPVFAILNPQLTYTLPNYQSACGAADIIMHTVERYFTNAATLDLTDQIAAVLVKNVIKHTKTILKHPNDYKARAELMWSGSLSHNDLTSARSTRGDWAVNQLRHELSAKYNLAHGASLTAIWSTWATYAAPCNQERFLKFAKEVMEVETPDKSDKEGISQGISKLNNFFKEIGLPTSLKDLKVNISDQDIDDMTIKASRYHSFKPGNILLLEESDIKNIYMLANT